MAIKWWLLLLYGLWVGCRLLGERGFTVKRKIPSIRSKEVTYRLGRALKDCLCVSPVLTTIELQGIPLRQRDVAVLAKVNSSNN